jgi:hypothetical protein
MLDSLVRVSRRGKENHFANLSRANRRHAQVNYQSAFPINPTKPDNAGHSAPPASEWGNMTQLALVSFASVSAISGTFSLSFQSSLHLSLTVLVRYRSPTNI